LDDVLDACRSGTKVTRTVKVNLQRTPAPAHLAPMATAAALTAR
jgi:hypothetical protein